MKPDTPADEWSETTPSAAWMAAAELCAMDVAFWGDNPRLGLAIICNDVFHPAADSEDVPPSLIHEVLAIVKSDSGWRDGSPALMQWIAKRRGYPEDMEWWSKRNPRDGKLVIETLAQDQVPPVHTLTAEESAHCLL